jgi:hypothetical protein
MDRYIIRWTGMYRWRSQKRSVSACFVFSCYSCNTCLSGIYFDLRKNTCIRYINYMYSSEKLYIPHMFAEYFLNSAEYM